MGGVIQYGIGMSFECQFRSAKQYHMHDSFIEMGRQMSEILSYITLLIKISFNYQMGIFETCSQSLILFVMCEDWYELESNNFVH